jgi:hypothetical protein
LRLHPASSVNPSLGKWSIRHARPREPDFNHVIHSLEGPAGFPLR